ATRWPSISSVWRASRRSSRRASGLGEQLRCQLGRTQAVRADEDEAQAALGVVDLPVRQRADVVGLRDRAQAIADIDLAHDHAIVVRDLDRDHATDDRARCARLAPE